MTHLEVNTALQRVQSSDRLDRETNLVNQLVRSALNAGVKVDPYTIINLYVSLKSKPFVILVGRENRRKRILIEGLVKVLTKDDPCQSQFMLGHAWGAERSENVALFTNAQYQFNVDKILTIIEEALEPDNTDKAYFACLDGISPAEVVWHFSKLRYQFHQRKDSQMNGTILPESYVCPPNFFSIGIMDTSQFSWYGEDLLSQTNVIHWQERDEDIKKRNSHKPLSSVPNRKNVWLNLCVREERIAYLKLLGIIKDQPNVMLPLLKIEKVLLEHGAQFSPRTVTNEVVVYLANAWSDKGNGLFSSSPYRNLEVALDIAISQTLLPREWTAFYRSANLRQSIRDALTKRFTHSRAFLDRFDNVL